MKWNKQKINRLIRVYKKHTKKETCKILNLTDGQLRGILGTYKIRVRKSPDWTVKEINILKDAYANTTNGVINLGSLSKNLKRLKSNVCRKARELNLTDKNRNKAIDPEYKRPKKSPEEKFKILSEKAKKQIKKHGHPKGFLGKRHTITSRIIISKKSKESASKMTLTRKREIVMKAMKTRFARGVKFNPHGKWHQSWQEIGGRRIFFRSMWEANYGRYLQWLKERGEIIEWEHEPETFWFEGVRRGTVSYLPDFRITEKNGSIVYHEVKGWMDDRSKTKIKRMAKYHAHIKLIVIDAKAYQALKRTMQPIIKDWQTDSKNR